MDRRLRHAHVVLMAGGSFRNPPPSKRPEQPANEDA